MKVTLSLIAILLFSALVVVSTANWRMRKTIENHAAQAVAWQLRETEYQSKLAFFGQKMTKAQDSIAHLQSDIEALTTAIKQLKNYEKNTVEHVANLSNNELLQAIRARYPNTATK